VSVDIVAGAALFANRPIFSETPEPVGLQSDQGYQGKLRTYGDTVVNTKEGSMGLGALAEASPTPRWLMHC